MSHNATIAIAVQAGIPTIIWGPPGVGKSAFVRALTRAMDYGLETVIASIHEPADFAGLPIVTDDHVRLAPPRWALNAIKNPKTLIFHDEISTAPPAVQAALLRVVLDNVVGDAELPKEVRQLAAANPVEMAAGGWELSPPMANRFCHLDWELNHEAWIEGMQQNFPDPVIVKLPENWRDNVHQARSLIASFINTKRGNLHALPKAESDQGKAWPSPRTWTFAAELLAAATSVGADENTVGELIAGCVGPGAAHEFLNWRKELDLPDPKALLKDPKSLKIRDEKGKMQRGDRIYAILSSVVSVAISEKNTEVWNQAWKVLAKAAEAGAPDIAASGANLLARNKPEPNVPTPQEVGAFLPLLRDAGIFPTLPGSRK